MVWTSRSGDCVSHQRLQQTKHLLIIINKRCGRPPLRALVSLQLCFPPPPTPTSVWPFLLTHAFQHRMLPEKKEKKKTRSFFSSQLVQRSASWGLTYESRHHQKPLRRPQSSGWVQRKHTPVYIHRESCLQSQRAI